MYVERQCYEIFLLRLDGSEFSFLLETELLEQLVFEGELFLNE